MNRKHQKFVLLTVCVGVTLLTIRKMVLTTDRLESLLKITRAKNELLELSRYELIVHLKDGAKVPVAEQDEILGANLPSLPYVAWKANKEGRWQLKCGQYPYIFDVSFYNTYWQTAKLGNFTVQIYGEFISRGETVGIRHNFQYL
jgi:hypothetical protein